MTNKLICHVIIVNTVNQLSLGGDKQHLGIPFDVAILGVDLCEP
jgi:hypothetical protein